MAVAGIMLNMLVLSDIIWQDQTFYPLEMGILIGTRTWGMAVSGLLIGRLADKFSRKFLLLIMVFLIAAGRFLNAFAPMGEPISYGYFLFCFSLTGLGLGGIEPIILSYTNDALSKEKRSRFFGIQESSRQVGATFGTILSAILFQFGYWKLYFWIAGSILFIIMIILWIYLKEPKRGQNSQKDLSNLLNSTDIVYEYQLNAKTVKSTIFSPTNIIAFIEGIFTWLIFAIALYMIYPYLQSEPYNISPIANGILMIIFGMPGAIFGGIVFGKISDTFGKRNIKWRVILIIFSIITLFISIVLVFVIPLQPLTPEEGNNIILLFSYPSGWMFGLIIFTIRAVLGIYNVNQNPIIQAINLPEAQGTVSSWGQFLETIANGLGPVIAGYILSVNEGNYFEAAWITLLLGIPGAFLWILALKFINSDVARIQRILKLRTKELHERNNGIKEIDLKEIVEPNEKKKKI
nr:MFS transporter [Candidatus Prometheoarchaeum syntrophicum]